MSSDFYFNLLLPLSNSLFVVPCSLFIFYHPRISEQLYYPDGMFFTCRWKRLHRSVPRAHFLWSIVRELRYNL